MQIRHSRQFIKNYAKAPEKIKKAFKKRRGLFVKNPYNPKLKNHQLKGKLKQYRSINITGDWRAWYSTRNNIVFFETLGTHSQLYN